MEGELPRLCEHYGVRSTHATRYHCDHVGMRRLKQSSSSRLGLWNGVSNFMKVRFAVTNLYKSLILLFLNTRCGYLFFLLSLLLCVSSGLSCI